MSITESDPRHGSNLCGAKGRSGRPCTQAAGHGTDHPGIGRCKWHGGCTPNHRRAADLVKAQQACDRLGVAVEIDPGDALIHAVWEAAGNVEFYRGLVAELPTHPEPGELTFDVEGKPHWTQGEIGVYGPTYHQSGIPTGEAKPNVLVVMYNQERDRLVETAKVALAAGVEERRVRLAESDGRVLFAAVGKAMAAIDLAPEQIEVFRGVLAESLREPAGIAR